MYTFLLITHIAGGFAALLSSFVAIYTKVVRDNHKIHVISGKVFVWGMTIVFLTTVPMTLIKPNVFLLVIGIFSFYLTFNGWRSALNRSGLPQWPDKTADVIMLVTSMIMLSMGVYYYLQGSGFGIVLGVFGLIGGQLAFSSLRAYKDGPVKGKERIRTHLGSMMGATIAAITAFLVTNIETDPVWIVWIAPTVVITPLIIYSSRKVLGSSKSK
ncbi:MAG: hypothetical protein LAT67_00905 [Balneolales bacterium]|nr:hypothetical protein [Balneolales bacterium]